MTSAVVVTHDPKFLSPVLQALEQVTGNTPRIVRQDFSAPLGERDLLDAADIVVFEWLGRASLEYAAGPRPPGQRMIVRLHRFEIDTPWPKNIDISAVDTVVVVSDRMKTLCCTRFHWPEDKVIRIYNPSKLPMRPLHGKPLNSADTLGLLGYVPQLKRLDLALDLLEGLRQTNPAMRLKLKGAPPWAFDSIWHDPEQRSYFKTQFARIAELGAGIVQVEPLSDDVSSWFEDVGWILSLSDIESFHLAPIEGVFSGATPLVLEREGAAEIFPTEFMFETIPTMMQTVASIDEYERRHFLKSARRLPLIKRYGLKEILADWIMNLSHTK